jgi:hypothetical protein
MVLKEWVLVLLELLILLDDLLKLGAMIPRLHPLLWV